MKKKELIEVICKKEGLNIEAVGEDLSFAYDKIFSTIIEVVAAGEVVEVPDFGSFYRTEKHLGRTRVPSSKKIPNFSPDYRFRDAVLTKKEF